jgi:phosphoglycolate phosphatase-like HAD superfamily hydrolase
VSDDTLLLFDIDGTLVWRATDAHARALHDALREVHGIEPTSVRPKMEFAGRTDAEIARAYLVAAGVDARQIDERADDVREACCIGYAELVPDDLSQYVLPGVPALLEGLAGDPERWRLALVTGNYEAVARLKLARAGIGGYFESGLGGFGSDAEDRAALPPIARRRAGSTGQPHPRDRTLVIGDTPRDIACARADGIRCIAVATGPHSVEELGDADAVASDATALGELLATLPRGGQ